MLACTSPDPLLTRPFLPERLKPPSPTFETQLRPSLVFAALIKSAVKSVCPVLVNPATHNKHKTYRLVQCWRCAKRRSPIEDSGSSPVTALPGVWMSPDGKASRNRGGS